MTWHSGGWRPQRLGSVTLEVPDPAATADFLSTGLHFDVAASGSGGWTATTGSDYGAAPPARTLTLRPGPALRLVEVTFDVRSTEDLPELQESAGKVGARVEEVAPDKDGGRGVVVVDGDGLRLVCRVPAPARTSPLPASPVRPRRLGHLNLATESPGHTATLLSSVLGLRLSEQIGDRLFFLRVGSEHHNVGIRPTSGPEPGVHHIAFEVSGWEAYRVVCDHLAAHGLTVEYGPGRHIPGQSLFTYVRDPSSGLRLELFSDMAHINDEQTYEPIKWEMTDRPQTINQWGPGPPEAYLAG